MNKQDIERMALISGFTLEQVDEKLLEFGRLIAEECAQHVEDLGGALPLSRGVRERFVISFAEMIAASRIVDNVAHTQGGGGPGEPQK